MDEHGNEVLNLGSFALLPQHVVRLILARDELKADEFSKFQASMGTPLEYYSLPSSTPPFCKDNLIVPPMISYLGSLNEPV